MCHIIAEKLDNPLAEGNSNVVASGNVDTKSKDRHRVEKGPFQTILKLITTVPLNLVSPEFTDIHPQKHSSNFVEFWFATVVSLIRILHVLETEQGS